MKRRAYRELIAGAACNLDSPLTHFAAAKEMQPIERRLLNRAARQYLVVVVSGEALLIARNARSWPLSDGRAAEITSERRRDSEFARIVAGAQP